MAIWSSSSWLNGLPFVSIPSTCPKINGKLASSLQVLLIEKLQPPDTCQEPAPTQTKLTLKGSVGCHRLASSMYLAQCMCACMRVCAYGTELDLELAVFGLLPLLLHSLLCACVRVCARTCELRVRVPWTAAAG